uniref:WWE domain-containing protein n=1 Tax=Arcella intermedia TaxID=1963864 RepID=A0A6B2LAJ0_9EUKA
MIKFTQGAQTLNLTSKDITARSPYFFAWHGTSTSAIVPICWNGFDPLRRSGQAYGPGEYFGVNPSISHGYCRGGSYMLVNIILNGSFVKHVPNFCFVVNNPSDNSYSYCMPLLVIQFGTNQPTPFQGNFNLNQQQSNNNNIQLDKLNDIGWKSPFRWCWKHDNGTFEPYRDDIHELIEQFYDKWKSNSSIVEYRTPPITRYVDDVPQPYLINFSTMLQINTSTGYTRSIKREEMRIHYFDAKWYCNQQNGWTRFELLDQDKLETAYQNYQNGSGQSVVVLRLLTGREDDYIVNFVTGTQTNKTTNTTRNIRRC